MQTNNTNSKDKVGPLIGSVIIILIITLGAFYLFSIIKDKVNVENQNIQETQTDDITEIETDLDSTEVEEMEMELRLIEEEFQI